MSSSMQTQMRPETFFSRPIPDSDCPRANKLVFVSGEESIAIELLRGGKNQQLKLPDANAVPILHITANDRPGRVEETSSKCILCILC